MGGSQRLQKRGKPEKMTTKRHNMTKATTKRLKMATKIHKTTTERCETAAETQTDS